MKQSELPSKFRPLSPWTYFGLAILYAIPALGLIFLLIHTFSEKNINRRNFARSYWCWIVLLLIFLAIFIGLAYAGGGPEGAKEAWNELLRGFRISFSAYLPAG